MISAKDNALTLQQLLTSLAPVFAARTEQNGNATHSTGSDNANNASTTGAESAYQQLLQADPTVLQTAFQQFQLDSRQLAQGDVLVLLKSQTHDDARSGLFAQQVMHKAAFILSEIPLEALNITEPSASIVFIPHIRAILGSLIQTALLQTTANSDGKPLQLPQVAAVTGTNGKTTISQLLAQLCQGAGMSSAIMGTAGNGRLGQLIQASHTTGDALAVQNFLLQMAQASVDLLALEASSHGLHQQRLQGVPIKVAIYTNLSRDHLDYHADMAEYAEAKAMLFDRQHFPTLTHAIINADDEFAPLMLARAQQSGLEVWTYSLEAASDATFIAQQIEPSLEGARIEIASKLFSDISKETTAANPAPAKTIWVDSPLLGRFNVANLLAAIAGALALGVTVEQIPALVATLEGASGRMQRIENTAADGQGCFIVDYAHTPDALQQVMTSLKAHCEGTLWAVFGCGGDRDAGKRPLMAQAGLAVADQVILTADNPRSEDPLAILQDMQAGMNAEQHARTHIEADRRKAIHYAVAHAQANDIVVIAGKGHETYQEINGVRYDFDDTVVVSEALQQQSAR
jgi:UDP-N-acetylmuramoyl-L-alanyl-D-glutamate--2,6-diaminopimelate ligase